MAEVLVQNARGRYVLLTKEQADSYLATRPADKKTGLPRVVSQKDGDYEKGVALAKGEAEGQVAGGGVRGDKVLERTGEGLV